jgi:hypothetical protein
VDPDEGGGPLAAVRANLTRRVGPLPVWGYLGIGAALLVVWRVSRGGAPAEDGAVVSTDSTSPWPVNAFPLGGTVSNPGPGPGAGTPGAGQPGGPVPVTTPVLQKAPTYSIKVSGKTGLWDATGKKVLSYISGATLKADQKVKVSGRWLYRISEGRYKGRYISPGRTTQVTTVAA